MKNYIGIDGGGSKTIFAIADEQGNILGKIQKGSASYKQIGMDGLLELLQKGMEEISEYRETEDTQIAGCCFGMPNFGESPVNDKLIQKKINELFTQFPVVVVNDCEVGWAGSLLLEPGINIVAGTGSIAYGKNTLGETARCGGWSEWFSDEGSGRWLGMKAVQLFSKQSDGRIEKGPLHQIVREQLKLQCDEDIIDIFEKEILSKRDKIASLQKLLLEAAKAGDQSAIDIYGQAALELAQIVKGVKDKIFPNENCAAAYSGGIFKVGDFVLKPFREEIEKYGMHLEEPKAEPYVGAALLAVSKFN